MEKLKDLGKDRTGLGIVCFLVTRIVLVLVDILSIGAYFGIVLYLLYLTFLKDCLEILVYAVVKFSTRLKWLYQIFQVHEFLYTEANDSTTIAELNSTEENELETNVQKNLDGSTSRQITPEISPNYAASSSFNSEFLCRSQLLKNSQPRSTSEAVGGNDLSFIFDSPRSSKFASRELIPRKLSVLSTQVVSSTDNIINETNFENVDLYSDEPNEIDSKTSREELSMEQSPSKWSISKIKFFDSFRKKQLPSPGSLNSQIVNLAEKATPNLPHKADNDKLISDKNGSPEQIGCCSYLPHFLRPNYQMSSTSSYARF